MIEILEDALDILDSDVPEEDTGELPAVEETVETQAPLAPPLYENPQFPYEPMGETLPSKSDIESTIAPSEVIPSTEQSMEAVADMPAIQPEPAQADWPSLTAAQSTETNPSSSINPTNLPFAQMSDEPSMDDLAGIISSISLGQDYAPSDKPISAETENDKSDFPSSLPGVAEIKFPDNGLPGNKFPAPAPANDTSITAANNPWAQNSSTFPSAVPQVEQSAPNASGHSLQAKQESDIPLHGQSAFQGINTGFPVNSTPAHTNGNEQIQQIQTSMPLPAPPLPAPPLPAPPPLAPPLQTDAKSFATTIPSMMPPLPNPPLPMPELAPPPTPPLTTQTLNQLASQADNPQVNKPNPFISTLPPQASTDAVPVNSWPMNHGQTAQAMATPMEAEKTGFAIEPPGNNRLPSKLQSKFQQTFTNPQQEENARLDKLSRAEASNDSRPGTITDLSKFIIQEREKDSITLAVNTDPNRLDANIISNEDIEYAIKALSNLATQVNLAGSAILSHEGLMIHSTFQDQLEGESMAIKAFGAFMGSEEVSERLGYPGLQQLVLRTQLGHMIVARARVGLFFVISNGTRSDDTARIAETLARIVSQ